jgi:signal transduction histidine kinase
MDVVTRVVEGRRLLGTVVAVLGQDVRVHGRPHDLATVLLNVLVNAERHAPGTAVTVDVAVSADRVRICVTDGGPGISPEHRESVFAHGWCGPGRPAGTGHGIGLHSARELMRGQAGELELVPSAHGAALVLTLRLAAGTRRTPQGTGRPDPERQPVLGHR